REDIGDQPQLGVEYIQRLARQRGSGDVTQLLDAVFRARDAVAIQDLDPEARQQSRQGAAQGDDNLGQACRVVTDQVLHDGQFDPVELLVDIGQRDGKQVAPAQVNRVRRV